MDKLYSVLDNKSHLFSPVMQFRSDQQAIRYVAEIANNPKSTIAKFPMEFDLFYLGNVDPETGNITSNDIPKFVISADNARQSMVERSLNNGQE